MPDAPLIVGQQVLARGSQQATGLPQDDPSSSDESDYDSTDTDSDDEASWEAAHGACHSESAKLFLLAFRCMSSTAIDLILKAVHLPTFQPSQIPWTTSQKLKQQLDSTKVRCPPTEESRRHSPVPWWWCSLAAKGFCSTPDDCAAVMAAIRCPYFG